MGREGPSSYGRLDDQRGRIDIKLARLSPTFVMSWKVARFPEMSTQTAAKTKLGYGSNALTSLHSSGGFRGVSGQVDETLAMIECIICVYKSLTCISVPSGWKFGVWGILDVSSFETTRTHMKLHEYRYNF